MSSETQQGTERSAARRQSAPEGDARQDVKTTAQTQHANEHLRKLTDTLKENLSKCAVDPDVDAVHDTRTGTRRIEAALDAVLQNTAGDVGDGQDGLTKAMRGWGRLLKAVRRAAAPVRDLDVQRKLLKTLASRAETGMKTPADVPENGMTVQIDKLDDALKSERGENVAVLKKNAAKWAAKLDGAFEAYAAAPRPPGRGRKPNAAKTALDAFARLAYEMQQLDAGNLHDFRKGAKKARYMAEQGGDDEHAGMVGKALKKLQDEIGDWHDWVMLDAEAHKHLDENGAKLTAEIERMRDAHFAMAMKTEAKMRGRLIGEGLATRGARRTGTRVLVAKQGLESQKSIESA
jgi:CHAD domain-containing protein